MSTALSLPLPTTRTVNSGSSHDLLTKVGCRTSARTKLWRAYAALSLASRPADTAPWRNRT